MYVACRPAHYCCHRSSVTKQYRRFDVAPMNHPDMPAMLKRLDKRGAKTIKKKKNSTKKTNLKLNVLEHTKLHNF